MPKTVLVTGATGFIASNLIPKLAKRGYKIRAFVRQGATQEQLKELILHKFTDQGLQQVRYHLRKAEEEIIHQTVIGTHTKKNVPVILLHETGEQDKMFMRERKIYSPMSREQLQEDRGEVLEEVLIRQVDPEGLTFEYAYIPEGQGSRELSWTLESFRRLTIH